MLARLRTAFSIDLRSLALFRVCLALMILFDLYLRSFNITAFYTDAGVLPRALWLNSTHSFHWSLHAASGLFWYQCVLFVLAAVFALGLLFGYRTRLMAVLSWVMLQSLVNRNVYLSQGGDDLLVILAFWAMFLPLNARYSIDSALSQPHRRRAAVDYPAAPGGEPMAFFSVATVAVLLQVMYLYFFTAILKTGDAWRVDFDAAWYAVSLGHYSTPIGLFASGFPGFLKLATMAVLVLEVVAIFTVFSPWYHVPLRLITLAGLYLLHGSFLLMLYIGLFPLIDWTALTLLIPGALWVWLDRRHNTADSQTLRLYHRGEDGLSRKLCLLLREFFLPRNTLVEPVPAQLAGAGNSGWLLQTTDGQLLRGREALNAVLSQRVLVRWLSWPLRTLLNLDAPGRWLLAAAQRLGQRIGGSIDRALQWRPLSIRPRWHTQLLAAIFLYLVTFINISGIPQWGIHKPDHVLSLQKITRLDQRWDMFAPYPLQVSIYPVVVGTLRDGREVDLLASSMEPPVWTAPDNMYAVYGGYRWRKYLNKVGARKNATNARKGYGAWLCRNWNHPQRARQQQLATAKVYFIRIHSDPARRKASPAPSMVWHQWCYAEFAPKN